MMESYWWMFADTLLRFAQKWITNGRHSYATLFILQTIFERYTPDQLDSLPDFRKSIEGLIMYTGIPYLLGCFNINKVNDRHSVTLFLTAILLHPVGIKSSFRAQRLYDVVRFSNWHFTLYMKKTEVQQTCSQLVTDLFIETTEYRFGFLSL